jgi:hypothetical protein
MLDCDWSSDVCSSDLPYGTGPTATAPRAAVAAKAGTAKTFHGDPAFRTDASASSSFLTPTALIPPAGTCAFYDYAVIILGVSCSLGDRVQLSATTVVPAGFLAVNAAAKVQLFHGPAFRLAVHGSAFLATAVEDGGGSGLATFGVIGTQCLAGDCSSHMTVSAHFLTSDGPHEETQLVLSGSLALRIEQHIRLMGEVNTGPGFSSIGDDSAVAALWYGVRYASRHASVDVGLFTMLSESFGSEQTLPFLSFTFRG